MNRIARSSTKVARPRPMLLQQLRLFLPSFLLFRTVAKETKGWAIWSTINDLWDELLSRWVALYAVLFFPPVFVLGGLGGRGGVAAPCSPPCSPPPQLAGGASESEVMVRKGRKRERERDEIPIRENYCNGCRFCCRCCISHFPLGRRRHRGLIHPPSSSRQWPRHNSSRRCRFWGS